MTTGTLHAHPNFPCAAIEALTAQLRRPAPDRLALRFTVAGDIAQLLIPATAPPQRRDGLWKHTCFEVFLRVGQMPAYYEFNFSPSGEWAAYRFDGYREGMIDANVGEAPTIAVTQIPGVFTLDAAIVLPDEVVAASPQPVALASVIEDRTARISYWAVAHAPAKPDFHHDHGFALRLPA